jgi:hypothetical protein
MRLRNILCGVKPHARHALIASSTTVAFNAAEGALRYFAVGHSNGPQQFQSGRPSRDRPHSQAKPIDVACLRAHY